MSPAAIDIVVPLYNAATTLDELFESIARQEFTNFRVIAVDDGSTDDTPRLLAIWAGKDPRFTIITKANGGIVDALNVGMDAVTAPLVARMDGDDLSLPKRLILQLAYLQSNPECVAVGCSIEHIDQDGRTIYGLPLPDQPDTADMTRLPAREPYIIHPFLMARTQALRLAGGYRNVPYSEDSDLFWRLAEKGRLYNLPEKLGKYRMHLGSISGSSVINGRIMAVGSQLGAASARRRHQRKQDLTFASGLTTELRQAENLQAMSTIAARMLEPEELPIFRLATAVKLLELANYRPYEIEASDCAFVRAVMPPAKNLASSENLEEIDWYLTQTGSRLLRLGRVGDCCTLVPRRLWPKTLLKALLHKR